MLIGLSGKAKSGKDTVAEYLRLGYAFKTTAFAQMPKDLLAELFDLSPNQLYGHLKEVVDPRFGKSPRYIMQYILSACREIWPPVWICQVEKALPWMLKETPVVITDVRLQDEAEMVRRYGGALVRIERPGSGAVNGIAGHVSEIDLDGFADWDFILTNDASLDELYQRVDHLLKEVKYAH